MRTGRVSRTTAGPESRPLRPAASLPTLRSTGSDYLSVERFYHSPLPDVIYFRHRGACRKRSFGDGGMGDLYGDFIDHLIAGFFDPLFDHLIHLLRRRP